MMKEDLSDILRIESLLKTTLRPVTPNRRFVEELRERLVAFPRTEYPKGNSFDYVLWLAIGIGTSFLLVHTGMRAVLSFASALGIVHLLKGHLDERQIPAQRIAHR